MDEIIYLKYSNIFQKYENFSNDNKTTYSSFLQMSKWIENVRSTYSLKLLKIWQFGRNAVEVV